MDDQGRPMCPEDWEILNLNKEIRSLKHAWKLKHQQFIKEKEEAKLWFERYQSLKPVCTDVKRFMEILDRVEVSDNDKEFHPVTISSCRVMLTKELDEILKRFKEYTKDEKTD